MKYMPRYYLRKLRNPEIALRVLYRRTKDLGFKKSELGSKKFQLHGMSD